MKLKLLIVVLWGAVIVGGLAKADGESEAVQVAKRDDIKKMMEVTGAADLSFQVMNQMIDAFKQGDLGVPDEFWDDFMDEVDPNELVEMCIPSYEKHFSHEEIKQLLVFYESPVGKKVIEVQPAIMQECMMAGQEWGRKIGEEIAQKLEAEGY